MLKDIHPAKNNRIERHCSRHENRFNPYDGRGIKPDGD